MINKRKKRFNKLFVKLPSYVIKQAEEAFRLFQEDLYNKSLGFGMIEGDDIICSVRIGYRYRALGEKRGDTIEWYWIGSHEDYNHMLKH